MVVALNNNPNIIMRITCQMKSSFFSCSWCKVLHHVLYMGTPKGCYHWPSVFCCTAKVFLYLVHPEPLVLLYDVSCCLVIWHCYSPTLWGLIQLIAEKENYVFFLLAVCGFILFRISLGLLFLWRVSLWHGIF